MKTIRALCSAGMLVGMCAIYVSAQQPTPPPPPPTAPADTGNVGGIPKGLTQIDDRAIPFLSKWTICESQVQKMIQGWFKNTLSRDPGVDLGKINIQGEPKRNGRFEIYRIQCGSAVAVRKEIDDMMLPAMKDLLAQPVGEEGEEKYCHDFTAQSAVGSKVGNEIQQKVGIGENNYRMPTGGRQYFSLSAFEQFLRVGATNWWLQNYIGNDASGYQFWHAGEAKVIARRPLIDNSDNTTRRVIPNLLKFHLGYAYRLNDIVDNKSLLGDLAPKRQLNISGQGRMVAGMEAFIPLGEDMRSSVLGVNVNLELPIARINESAVIDPTTYTKINLKNEAKGERLEIIGPHPTGEVEFPKKDGIVQDFVTSPLLRTSGQVTFFYTWWWEVEGSENPPDNIFRAELGVNYTEVQDVAIVRNIKTGLHHFMQNNIRGIGGPGLVNYRPESIMDWIFAKFEYRNETTFPFGASVQLSNQIFMADFYFPLFGNWMYLEAKYAVPIRDKRPYELSSYFMISPVFRILIPR